MKTTLRTALKNLFSGKSHNEPELTVIEKALLTSLRTEPDKWHFSEAQHPDHGRVLHANNREKGVVVGCAWFMNASVWSGKLKYGQGFADMWYATASKMNQDRIDVETKAAADAVEAHIRAVFKL